MNFIKDVKLCEDNKYNIIVEIRKGSKDKYELVEPTFDSLAAVRKIKIKYPFYYGCFPQTHAPDNDPLDMILLTNKKREILNVVEVMPIGIVKTIDAGEQDDKVLVIDTHEILPNILKMRKKALKFLKSYKGRKSQMILDTKVYGVIEAIEAIDKCHKAYKDMNKTSIKVNF